MSAAAAEPIPLGPFPAIFPASVALWPRLVKTPRPARSLRNPRYALGSLYRELTLADERSLTTITGVSARRIRGLLNEPIHTPDFAARAIPPVLRSRVMSETARELYRLPEPARVPVAAA